MSENSSDIGAREVDHGRQIPLINDNNIVNLVQLFSQSSSSYNAVSVSSEPSSSSHQRSEQHSFAGTPGSSSSGTWGSSSDAQSSPPLYGNQFYSFSSLSSNDSYDSDHVEMAMVQNERSYYSNRINLIDDSFSGIDDRILEERRQNCLNVFKMQYLENCEYEEENGNNSSSCRICLENYEIKEQLKRIVKCKHEFHADCLDIWVGENWTCPLCRQDILSF